MTSIQSRPSEALQAMKFVGECLISQPTYFNDFVKYCSKHNLNRLKMNGLVYLLHIMVKDLEELSSAEIFEEKTYFECLCQIMQLVAGIYLRPSVRREVIAQLPLHVLPNLSKLAERIIDQRKWFIANIIECAKGTVVENDGNLVFCQDKPLQLTVIMTRIKYAADLECNFCFSLASVGSIHPSS
jgi:hypothetical protein